ncbi:MAG: M20/M25/M40 family metallo-hydrolase [bacterium]
MSNNENLLKLISDLISFKTVYPDKDEFTKCIKYIKNYFKGANSCIKEFEFNDSKSIIISNTDSKNFDVIFNGHIDVVPATENLFILKKEDDILYGRGVSDMKGQVAVMMQVMKKISKKQMNKKIALILTSDEERGGFDGVNKLLNEYGYSCEIAIVPDGGFDYSLVIEEKGVLQIKITTTGKSCHSSEPWNGDNAIEKLLTVFNVIQTNFSNPKNQLEWKTSFNIAKIEGGDSLNKVPGKASMYLDIRHIYDDKKDDLLSFIQKIDENLEVEILAIGHHFKNDENNLYVKKYVNVCEVLLDKKIKKIKFHGASDGRFFTEKNIPCIIMNPEGGNIHCDDEFVNLSSLSRLSDIYERYIEELNEQQF